MGFTSNATLIFHSQRIAMQIGLEMHLISAQLADFLYILAVI